MTGSSRYVVQFVDVFPSPLDPGVLYVSVMYSTAGHLCACGCGGEVVTKLSPARYRVVFDGEVSLDPSVAATALPCNSHYFIIRGEVDWHQPLTTRQIAAVRVADRETLDAARVGTRPGKIARILKALKGHRTSPRR